MLVKEELRLLLYLDGRSRDTLELPFYVFN